MSDSTTASRLVADLPTSLTAAVVERGRSTLRAPAFFSDQYSGNRRTKFVEGRMAASRCLRDLGCPRDTVGVGQSGEPQWPAEIVGSISHAREFSIAIAAMKSEVDAIGIDVEDDRDVEGIEPYVTRPEEAMWLDNSRGSDRRRRVISIFSAKEAVYKAFFPRVGRFFDFADVSVEPSDVGFTARFTTEVDTDFPPRRPFLVHSRWQGDVVLSWTALEPT